MFNHISIFKKGAVLIAVPLLVQCVFLLLLIDAQNEASRAQRLTIHTKVVIADAERLYQEVIESQMAIRNPAMMMIGGPAKSARPGAILDRLTASLVRLREQVSDNAPQQRKVDRVGESIGEFGRWVDDWEETERIAARDDRAKTRLRQEAAGVTIVAEIRRRLDAFLAGEERLDRERVGELERSWRRQNQVLIVSGALGVILAITVLLAFARGIARRLSVLTMNAQRLADGLELVEPLVGRDEIGRLDAVFHDMARSLVQRNRENETFVYSVSHDLRSPLVNLMGFSKELENDCAMVRRALDVPELPEEFRDKTKRLLETDIPESIQYILSAVSRVSAIIDALLRLSRSGRVEYHFCKLEIEPLIVRIVESLRNSIQERGAQIIVGDDLSSVWGDSVAVEQVFANLIANAINYLDPSRPGIVEIGRVKDRETSQPATHLVYHVKDNGLGISEAGQAKLFLPFQRFHAETTQGEGIGLALTRGIVQRHGGKIWAESRVGVGSEFYVSFPAEPLLDSKPSSKESNIADA